MFISTTRPKYNPNPFPVEANWAQQAITLKRDFTLNYYDLILVNLIIYNFTNHLNIVWKEYEQLSFLFDLYVGNAPIINFIP